MSQINPVTYRADGDQFLVLASKAGAETSPGWYWNLRANPDVTIEVGDEMIAVRATELTGAEREEKDGVQSGRFPGFAGYQQKTGQTIPVIALTRRDAPAPGLPDPDHVPPVPVRIKRHPVAVAGFARQRRCGRRAARTRG